MSATAVESRPSTDGEPCRRRYQGNAPDSDLLKVPAPIYRHAAPSSPWPWMNLNTDADEVQPVPPGPSDGSDWGQYPHSLFRNWTSDQVNRSQLLTKCSDRDVSTVYKIAVSDDGSFDEHIEVRTVRKDDAVSLEECWSYLGTTPPSNIRVQALFVEEMTTPILQMLGTRYNVEPFYFASSLNWIPSRYREDPKVLGDHISVVLPFIRTLKNRHPINKTKELSNQTSESHSQAVAETPLPYLGEEQIINTQAPLALPGNKALLHDLLSLHMVRNTTTSTIISYHPGLRRTSAKHLQSLVHKAGDSVYWSKIFKRSKDPTFLILATLWYAFYAWDEAFEDMLRYITALEYDILQFNNIKLTRELHKLQAHLLYYQQLLRDFHRSIEFIRNTPNPAMNAPSISDVEREDSTKLMHTETHNLMSEIERLTQQGEMLSDRVANAINLAFATVNIEDSKAMQRLAEVTKKDSTAMKQIAYLSMIFLPATYLANVFSMNVREINNTTEQTLAHYIVSAVILTLFISWLAIVLERDSPFHRGGSGILRRILWPVFYAHGIVSNKIEAESDKLP